MTDKVRGFELLVPDNWFEYDADYKASVCNGVGGGDQNPLLEKFLNKLPDILLPASDVHDFEYAIGGSSEDRHVADLRWRSNVLRAARQRYGGFWYRMFHPTNRLAFAFAVTLAIGGYRCLRLFGGSHFVYDTMADNAVERRQ